MENASKALIIAGAILISIILISIGIMVVQSAGGIVDSGKASLDTQQKQIFNSQFENYIGLQKGSSIRTLMGQVNTSNSSYDEDYQVSVVGPNGETEPDAIRANVRPTSNYNVEITTDKTTGLVSTITITATSSGSSSGKSAQ